MKTHIIPAIKLTLISLIFLGGGYTLLVYGFALLTPNQGNGDTLNYNGKKYYMNIGQSFTKNKYFWSRPSAIFYNASNSGGSNKGPSDKEYLQTIQTRIDTLLIHNPEIKKSDIPVDLVTASASGLDPDISVWAAKIQGKRIAKIRNIPESEIQKLILEHIEKPLLNFLGPEKINVLKLNIALDNMKK